MYDFDFDYETNGIELSWCDTEGKISRREAHEPKHPEPFMCVKHLAEFFGTGEHVLRAKIEELKDNNCPLFR